MQIKNALKVQIRVVENKTANACSSGKEEESNSQMKKRIKVWELLKVQIYAAAPLSHSSFHSLLINLEFIALAN